MAPVSGALEGAYYGVLRERLQFRNGERNVFFDESVDTNAVCGGRNVRDGAVVAVVALTGFGDETGLNVSEG